MVHPILTDRRRLAIYLSAWVPIEMLLALLLARQGTLGLVPAAILAAPLALVYAFICLSAFYVCRSAPLETAGPERTLGVHTAAAAVSSGIWLLAARLLAALAARLAPAFSGAPAAVAREQALVLTMGLLLFLLASAVHYVLLAAERSRDVERQALELRVLAREAELRALRSQIDPHFLFNSLNSIAGLIRPDPERARLMCQLLGDFLRDSLTLGGAARVSLRREVALAEQYLKIEQVRFGARLGVNARVSAEAGGIAVPPLILQPLVENAVRHGIATRLEGGTIEIDASRAGERAVIVVSNPRDVDGGRRGTGFGLDIVRRRLAASFGDRAALAVEPGPEAYRVSVTIPVEEAAA